MFNDPTLDFIPLPEVNEDSIYCKSFAASQSPLDQSASNLALFFDFEPGYGDKNHNHSQDNSTGPEVIVDARLRLNNDPGSSAMEE